jgi:hypothetical protein
VKEKVKETEEKVRKSTKNWRESIAEVPVDRGVKDVYVTIVRGGGH